MPEFLLTLLPSAAAGAAAGGAVVWFAKTWLGERIRRTIQHKYEALLAEQTARLQRENAVAIERLRADLAQRQDLQAAATASFLAGRAAAHDRTLKAIDELWSATLQIRDQLGTVVAVLDELSGEELSRALASRGGPTVLAMVEPAEIAKVLSATKTIEQVRPFVGDYIWTLFFAFRALILRRAFLISEYKTTGSVGLFLDDRGIRELVVSVLTPEEWSSVQGVGHGAYGRVRALIEEKILKEARAIISGEASAVVGLDQVRRIHEAATKIQVPEQPRPSA